MRPIDRWFYLVVAIVGIPPCVALLRSDRETAIGTALVLAGLAVCELAARACDVNRRLQRKA